MPPEKRSRSFVRSRRTGRLTTTSPAEAKEEEEEEEGRNDPCDVSEVPEPIVFSLREGSTLPPRRNTDDDDDAAVNGVDNGMRLGSLDASELGRLASITPLALVLRVPALVLTVPAAAAAA